MPERFEIAADADDTDSTAENTAESTEDNTGESATAELGGVLAALTQDDLEGSERRRLARRVAVLLAARTRTVGVGAVASGRWLGDLLLDVAPHIPVRDTATLTAHHHGLTGEALADALVRNASNITTAAGATAGTLVAAQWVLAPVLVAIPLEIVVETLVVAVVEVKLLAELHSAYEVPVPGTAGQRGIAYVMAWVRRRGVNPTRPWAISGAVSAVARVGVGRRMMGRFARNLGGLAPMLLGAVYGATSNRRQTAELAIAVRQDLRARRGQELRGLPRPQ